MFVADPPASVASVQSVDQSDVIEVTGTRPDQTLKIDRRTYQVRQTPHSRQADSLQLLRGLPAVTISPQDDQVMLLGNPSVTIMVDGRPIHSNSTQFLHTLHGLDIDRIEIITNPSAQYSAEGSGGIINFVLRKKQTNGVSGASSVDGSSYGRATANSSIKYKSGSWTYELQANADFGRSGTTTLRDLRSIESEPGGTVTSDLETGSTDSTNRNVEVQPKVTYDFNRRTSLSLQLSAAAGGGGTRSDFEFEGLSPGFSSFTERERSIANVSELGAEFGFDQKGSRQGETLQATASFFTFDLRNRQFGDLDTAGSFDLRLNQQFREAEAKVDWNHPIGKADNLAMGADWKRQSSSQMYEFTSVGPSFGPNVVDRFTGETSVGAAYATYQRQFGRWTFMPGLRFEMSDRSISTPGTPALNIRRTNFFPTLHVEHPLSGRLDLTLSYSKRIDRARLEQLRPFPVVQDVLSISEGNPELRDQSTDAYEANLHYHWKKLDAGVILYDRETSNLWSNSFFVDPKGFTVEKPVNAGHRSDRGAELDASTPILGRTKGTASINLFDSRVPLDPLIGPRTDEQFRYTANATLEWDGRDRGDVPGDIAQLQLDYSSAYRAFQTRSHGFIFPVVSYTHNISRTLALTATANGVTPLHFRQSVTAPLVQDVSDRRLRPEFRLKLVKTLGKPN